MKNFRETLNEELKNPEFKKGWDALNPEFERARQALDKQDENFSKLLSLAVAFGGKESQTKY